MKILLTQLRRIGDVITTTPAVRAVRHAWPEAQIDYMTESPSDEIFRHSPYVDNLIVLKRRQSVVEFIKTVRKLRAAKYHAMVDFFGNPTSAYLTALSGARYKIGFDIRFRRHFYTHTVNTAAFPGSLYAGLHKLALVALIGAESMGSRPEFFIGSDEELEADTLLKSLGVKPNERYVTLGIATRHAFRQWPMENFARLADELISRFKVKILPIYGPGEEQYPKKLRELMKHELLCDYPASGIGRMRALFERAALHIGCDNGPANIAKASDIPNIILYSNTHASSWTPPDSPVCVALEHNLVCKARCLHERCSHSNCIRLITVDEVLKEAEKFLKN